LREILKITNTTLEYEYIIKALDIMKEELENIKQEKRNN